jgi:hypothetical protein
MAYCEAPFALARHESRLAGAVTRKRQAGRCHYKKAAFKEAARAEFC